MKYILEKLDKYDTELSRKLALRLRFRYLKRRNTTMVSLVKFYENPDVLSCTGMFLKVKTLH